MNVLITGGTGLIGKALCRRLSTLGHQVTVYSRHPETVAEKCGSQIAAMGSLDEWTADLAFDAVVNLAGEPIFDARWSEARKALLWGSRVTLTEQLVARMASASQRPAVLISGSATGYYGDAGGMELLEDAPAGTDFGAELCVAWEQAAAKAGDIGVRVCRLRTGLVLSREGGLLGRMLPAFKLGLGALLGKGDQWMSWIHMNDYLRALESLLENSQAVGAFNLTAPHPVTNAEFTRSLAKTLHRPVLFTAPSSVLRLVLGEMSVLLVGGQRALPAALQAMGCTFGFATLDAALEDLLAQPS